MHREKFSDDDDDDPFEGENMINLNELHSKPSNAALPSSTLVQTTMSHASKLWSTSKIQIGGKD